MPQRGNNRFEVLYEDDTPFGYRVTNYSDVEHLICRDPFDAIAEIEEQFYSPIAYVEYRETCISRWHAHWRKGVEEPTRRSGCTEVQTVIPSATREQLHTCADAVAPKPHQRFLTTQPKTEKPLFTKEQMIALDTEFDRLLEFFIHERITNG